MTVLLPRVHTRRRRWTIQGEGVPTRTRANVRHWKPASAVRFSAGGGRTLALRTVSRSPRRSEGAVLARFNPADARCRSFDARGVRTLSLRTCSRHIGEQKEAGRARIPLLGFLRTGDSRPQLKHRAAAEIAAVRIVVPALRRCAEEGALHLEQPIGDRAVLA